VCHIFTLVSRDFSKIFARPLLGMQYKSVFKEKSRVICDVFHLFSMMLQLLPATLYSFT
jgi:hypothetical protein